MRAARTQGTGEEDEGRERERETEGERQRQRQRGGGEETQDRSFSGTQQRTRVLQKTNK